MLGESHFPLVSEYVARGNRRMFLVTWWRTIYSAGEGVVLLREIYKYPCLQGHSLAANDLDHKTLADQAV
jgi:hypothetical protein